MRAEPPLALKEQQEGLPEDAKLHVPRSLKRTLLSWYRDKERLTLGTAGLTGFLILWEVGSVSGYLNPLIFSSPRRVVAAFWDAVVEGELWGHLLASLATFMLGLLWAAVVGIVVGFVGGWSRRANYLLDPWITILYATPKVALVPLIIIVMGIEIIPAKVFIVFFIAIFPIVVNTLAGVRDIGKEYLDVARVFGASTTRQWTSIFFPGTIPFFLTGLRLAAVHGMVGVVVAELVAGNRGIGFIISLAGVYLDSATVMMGIVLLGLWGLLVNEIMRRVEGRYEVWRP